MEITICYEVVEEALLALNAPKLSSLIFALDQHLRELIKYGDDSERTKEALQKIRGFLYCEAEILGIKELVFR